ncbi:MAG: phosphoglycerate mutase family protein [Actinomycetota bacterium]
MRLYLIRHAHAGQRLPGGRDQYRPLSAQGRERASVLAELFEGITIDRLLASPATRCQQTLAVLAQSHGLTIDDDPNLFEGSDTRETLAQLASLDDEAVVACSHGDVIPAVLEQLGALGVPLTGRGCELGSVWVLERAKDRWVGARYVNPRAASLDPT